MDVTDRGCICGKTYLAVLQVGDDVVAGLAPVDDILAVPRVSAQGADVGTSIEAFADLFGGEGQACFESSEERLCWSHLVAARRCLISDRWCWLMSVYWTVS